MQLATNGCAGDRGRRERTSSAIARRCRESGLESRSGSTVRPVLERSADDGTSKGSGSTEEMPRPTRRTPRRTYARLDSEDHVMTIQSRFLGSALVLTALAALSAGCSKKETVSGCDIKTHGMSVDYKVMSDGTKSTVYVALHVGSYDSNTFADLCTGDYLSIKANGTAGPNFTRVSQKSGDSVKTFFGLDVVGTTSGAFVLDYTRTNDESVKGLTVTLPQPFNITLPTTASRKEPLVVTWDATDPSASVRIDVDDAGSGSSCIFHDSCIFHESFDVIGAPGSYTIPGGKIGTTAGSEKASCPIKVTVTRKIVRTAVVSPFGHSSQFEGQQIRVGTLTSTE
jgi:hypothetical protein